MVVRRSAIEDLQAGGFTPRLTGRVGKSMASGEDREMCLALRLAGWRIWYAAHLEFGHFMPARRLEWGYFLRTVVGAALASIEIDRLASRLAGRPLSRSARTRVLWLALGKPRMIAKAAKRVVQIQVRLRGMAWRAVGNPVAVDLAWEFGRLRAAVRSSIPPNGTTRPTPR
jgi:hypothetical protein